MKNFIGVLLVVVLLASASFAELFLTANPIGQGKWAVLGAYTSDSNVSNVSGWGAGTIGGYAGCGISDKLDGYVQLGQASLSGGPSATMTAYGGALKYNVMEESATMPVSVAVAGGYKTLSQTIGGATTNGSQIILGVGTSKMMVPFVPYGGLVYRSTTLGGTSTQIDLTVGSAMAFSSQGAVFAEYTLQSISNAGVNYSSGQIGIGVGYKI